MRDKDPYAQIFGLKSPWRGSEVKLALSTGEVTVHVIAEQVYIYVQEPGK